MATGRVLVVEDEEDVREPLVHFLSRRELQVDGVHNYETAISHVDRKTYHVAIIDIMLGASDNRDGFRVLEYINNLKEGTLSIIASQQDDPQISADALQQYGAHGYFSKATIRREGMEIVHSAVLASLSQSVVYPFGIVGYDRVGKPVPRSALVFATGGGIEGQVFSERCARLLQAKGGSTAIETQIERTLNALAPLLPPLRLPMRLAVLEETAPLIFGNFWSKQIGKAITVVICRRDIEATVRRGGVKTNWNGETLIQQGLVGGRGGDLVGLAFETINASRENFDNLPGPIFP